MQLQTLEQDFLKWRRGHQIRYDFTRVGRKRVFKPLPKQVYDTVVQSNDWSWHAPRTSDGQWLCCLNLEATSG